MLGVFGFLAFLSAAASVLPVPNPAYTPGLTNPAVSQSNIQSTICVSGWTTTIRPRPSYTNKLKRMGLNQYGYTGLLLSDFEEDHLVSLELGGHPTDPRNLWPEPWYANDGRGHDIGAHTKDRLETALKHLVCDETITLAIAQEAIAGDWVTAYTEYVGTLPAYRLHPRSHVRRKRHR